uniref:Uncharacterized protein n=1 Tax=Siphoviridae sp. ctuUw41 TaxID=2826503 RepID=A0A8S5MYE6_9CAUD|nr:MAG TPA: hypothetical protein [Siphoviridae sp. ctuUw41]
MLTFVKKKRQELILPYFCYYAITSITTVL